MANTMSPTGESAPPAALLLGSDPIRRGMVRDLLFSLPLYAVTLALLWVGVAWEITNVVSAWIQSIYSVVGFSVFYTLIRTGDTAEASRLRYSYGHLLFGVTNIVLAYGLFEAFRMWVVPMLCVLLVFDIRKFSARRIRNAALLALILIPCTLLWRKWLAPQDGMTESELMSLGGAMLLLPVVALVVRRVQSMQTQLDTQQRELADKLQRLHELATLDALTGLSNRRQMHLLLDDEIRRQARSSRPLCAALLDIDHFKRINDTYGHAVGDAVLRDFARLGKGCLRAAEALARWGGEEFVLLMPGTDIDEALAHLAEMHAEVAGFDWSVHAPGLAVGFSAGLAAWQPGEPTERWLERADRALYVAKARGRARTELG